MDIDPERAEYKPFIVTNSTKPERAVAIRLAAGDFAGRVSVSTYDPKDPEQRSRYARLVAGKERQLYSEGMVIPGARSQPRTAEEIDRQVIEHAEHKGLELIAIESRGPEGLGTFWQRVDEISAQAAHTVE